MHIGAFKARLNQLTKIVATQQHSKGLLALGRQYPQTITGCLSYSLNADSLAFVVTNNQLLAGYIDGQLDTICPHIIEQGYWKFRHSENDIRQAYLVLVTITLQRLELVEFGNNLADLPYEQWENSYSLITKCLSRGESIPGLTSLCVDTICPILESYAGTESQLSARRKWDLFCEQAGKPEQANDKSIIALLESEPEPEFVPASFIDFSAAKFDE